MARRALETSALGVVDRVRRIGDVVGQLAEAGAQRVDPDPGLALERLARGQALPVGGGDDRRGHVVSQLERQHAVGVEDRHVDAGRAAVGVVRVLEDEVVAGHLDSS
jgi:hypothetical protein